MNIEADSKEAPHASIKPPVLARPPRKVDGQMTLVVGSVLLVTIVWIGVLIYFALEVMQRLKG